MKAFSFSKGDTAIITAAIHEGHVIREELLPFLALEEHERSREEDPYTDYLSEVSTSRVIVNVSRFETDVNRPRHKAVYQRPEDAWGMQIWKKELPVKLLERSMETYDAFYRGMRRLLRHMIDRFGYFAVLDLHTYNHLREGAPANPAENPEINIGTAHNRPQWTPLMRHFINTLSGAKINGRTPDVRENIKFKGGEFSQWIIRHYGAWGFVLSVEFKKVFMDELTGIVDIYHLRDIRRALRFTMEELAEQLSLNRTA
ncbi:MAG TPA: N-formylglutamate amidohydrolase [Anseongella sp.]